MEDEWQRLLENSEADPLFSSWGWQHSWWKIWGESLNLELLLVAVYSSGQLVGIGPFYVHQSSLFSGFSTRRVHLIGNAWGIAPTVRTEYTNLIVHKKNAVEITEAIAEKLLQSNWHELLICDAGKNDIECLNFHISKQLKKKTSLIIRREARGVCVDAGGDFDKWISRLGPNTRRKLYNRRQYAEELGLKKAYYQDSEFPEFLSQLDDFHKARWGNVCFDRQAKAFHQSLMRCLPDNACAKLSSLSLSGSVVSVLYDIKVAKTVYNMQSGYLENFDKKLSLGTLHLGYAIETAFNDDEVSDYDLLVGEGLNTFYKQHYHGRKVDLFTAKIVRSGFLQLCYKVGALLPDKLRSLINRYLRL
jgi:hypothetical protein